MYEIMYYTPRLQLPDAADKRWRTERALMLPAGWHGYEVRYYDGHCKDARWFLDKACQTLSGAKAAPEQVPNPHCVQIRRRLGIPDDDPRYDPYNYDLAYMPAVSPAVYAYPLEIWQYDAAALTAANDYWHWRWSYLEPYLMIWPASDGADPDTWPVRLGIEGGR